MQLRGIFDDFTYDSGLDNWEDWYSSTPDSGGYTDPNQSLYDGEYQMLAAQSVNAAKAEVESAAASGRAVSDAAAQTLRAAGIDMNSVATYGGALFKLVANSSGKYIPQPQNTQAQTNMASNANKKNNLLLFGGIALAAFAFLR